LGLAFAFVFSLLAPAASVLASTDLTPGDNSVIVNANGDLVRLRTKPGTDGAVVGEYPEGKPVKVVDGPRIADDGADWYRVSVEGESGYIAAEFLALAGAPAPELKSDPVDEPADDGGSVEAEVLPPVTGTASIVNTNGDPIRCRAAASAEAAVISQFLGGDVVEVADEPTDAVTGDSEETENEESDDIVIMAEVVGTGTISGTNGDGVRCRSRASTEGNVITTLAEGSSVELRGTRRNDWFPVVCSGKKGYVWADFVSVSSSGGGSNGGGGGGIDPPDRIDPPANGAGLDPLDPPVVSGAVSSTPELDSVVLFAVGALGLGGYVWRQRRKSRRA